MKTAKVFRQIGRHLVLLFLACLWLVPILWLVVTSFGVDKGPNLSTFFPAAYTLDHYKAILLPGSDSVSQFPRWFMNTFTIAIFTCIISSMFVLMVAYAMSCMRFKARKPLMNICHHHEPVPRLPVHDRGVLHHEKPEPDQLHDGHGHCVFRGGGAGILDCQGIF